VVNGAKDLTAVEMGKCRWLKPRLRATIDYLERTGAHHLRHAMFSGLTTTPAFKASSGARGAGTIPASGFPERIEHELTCGKWFERPSGARGNQRARPAQVRNGVSCPREIAPLQSK
jgi:hypothetical protein